MSPSQSKSTGLSTDQKAWLATHGQQLLELIKGSGIPVHTALRALGTMATGYPCSNPPRWCKAGCKHITPKGACDRLGFSKTTEASFKPMHHAVDRWMGLHEWQFDEPRWGVLCDCPGFEAAA